MSFKLHIAIDFGTDGIGLAYAYNDEVFVHSKWNSKKYGDKVKPKTMILIDTDGSAVAFGQDAKYSYMTVAAKKDDWMLFERFKMSLYDDEHKLQNDDDIDEEEEEKMAVVKVKNNKMAIRSELTAVNGKKLPSEQVFIAAFQHIEKEAKRFLKKKKIRNIDDGEIKWIITVPAIWNDEAKDLMIQWAVKSGLCLNHSQCAIVYEPDCASLSILYKHRDKLSIGDRYILVDAGGGTVDVACHEIIEEFGVKEIVHPTGGKWGSCYIDDQYIRLLQDIFSKEWLDEFKSEAPNGFVEILHDFQAAKATFFSDRAAQYHNVRLPAEFLSFIEEKLEDGDEENEIELEEFVDQYVIMGNSDLVGLSDEFLAISCMVWQSLFDVVMDPTIAHIKKLLSNPALSECKYLCIVGGLSCSPYFQHEMGTQFVSNNKYNLELIVPVRPILSVVEGAAYFGLIKDYIKARVLRYSYGKTIIWPLQRAIAAGIPSEHIERYKSWNKNANAFGVKGCFMTIARKNQEVKHDDIFTTESHLFDPEANIVTINILCSHQENPKIKDDGWRIAQLKLDINDEDRKRRNVKIITEFHFYDTTLHVFVYRSHSPNIKQEIQLDYAKMDQ